MQAKPVEMIYQLNFEVLQLSPNISYLQKPYVSCCGNALQNAADACGALGIHLQLMASNSVRVSQAGPSASLGVHGTVLRGPQAEAFTSSSVVILQSPIQS